ncbi:ZIFL1 [Symbiodinium natans]|uniref:ZIFL1 protein n=1 Tax=Symbiodinium natans TaxID=878477 RepID=A0A812KFL9_9DINO|nr:ZIFL1 [Symbiodinium natans]
MYSRRESNCSFALHDLEIRRLLYLGPNSSELRSKHLPFVCWCPRLHGTGGPPGGSRGSPALPGARWNDSDSRAISLHVLANANLMTKNFDDALKTAQDSETAFRALRDTAAEAASMMLQSGAHLGRQDFEEALCRGVQRSAHGR